MMPVPTGAASAAPASGESFASQMAQFTKDELKQNQANFEKMLGVYVALQEQQCGA